MIDREAILLLLDSDAAKKLCQFDLVEFLLASIKFEASDLGVLPQLRFQLHLNNEEKAIRIMESRFAVENAKKLVSSAFEVEISAGCANPILTLDRPDLDTGELTLFAALSETEKGQLLSGDKRAYIALSKVEPIQELQDLWVRFLCLEEAILIILSHSNFAAVSRRIRSNPNVDKAVALTFGASVPSPKNGVEEALKSYVNHLEQKTAGKYVPIMKNEKPFKL